MRILIVHNPIAGRGRAEATAQEAAHMLERDGHTIIRRATGATDCERSERRCDRSFVDRTESLTPAARLHERSLRSQSVAPQTGALTAAGAGADVFVVIGGDGTMNLAAPHAIEAGAAVYQVPFGTENLFAREFGMMRDLEHLRAAIRNPRTMNVDVGIVNGSIFLLMASIGLDAEVIHELSARRSGAISHRSYLLPIARQFVKWKPPELSIVADGEHLVSGERGMVVVGNARQYAFRFDPAVRASMTDGLLDLAFFRIRSRAHLLRLALATRLHRHAARTDVLYHRAREISIDAATPQHAQVDGEAMIADSSGDQTAATTPLHLTVKPGALRVLLPAS